MQQSISHFKPEVKSMLAPSIVKQYKILDFYQVSTCAILLLYNEITVHGRVLNASAIHQY